MSSVAGVSSWTYLCTTSSVQPARLSNHQLLFSVVSQRLEGFSSGPENIRCTFLCSLLGVTFSPVVHPPQTALTFTYRTAPSPLRNGLQTAHCLCIHAERKLSRDTGRGWTEKWKWQLCCKIDGKVEGGGNSRPQWTVGGLFFVFFFGHSRGENCHNGDVLTVCGPSLSQPVIHAVIHTKWDRSGWD